MLDSSCLSRAGPGRNPFLAFAFGVQRLCLTLFLQVQQELKQELHQQGACQEETVARRSSAEATVSHSLFLFSAHVRPGFDTKQQCNLSV